MLVFYSVDSTPEKKLANDAARMVEDFIGRPRNKSVVKDSIVRIAIMDSQRTDDRFTMRQIEKLELPPQLAGRTVSRTKVFSCEYSAQYTHGSGAIGDTWKTKFMGWVKNPPSELISMVMPKALASAVTPEDIAKTLVQRIVGPERTMTYGQMCVYGAAGIVVRNFVAYSAEHAPVIGTTESMMTIDGGGYFDGVIKKKIAFRLDKDKTLKEQLQAAVDGQFTITFKTVPEDRKPAASNFFPAAPLSQLINQICRDNNMTFDILPAELIFYDTTATGAPKQTGDYAGSFLGKDGLIIFNFALSNFVQAKFYSEVFDIELFKSFIITNDAGYAFFQGLNEYAAKPKRDRSFLGNISTSGIDLSILIPDPPKKYNFFVLAYTLTDGREAKGLQVTATNNWVLGEMRVSALLENTVYLDALANKSKTAATDGVT